MIAAPARADDDFVRRRLRGRHAADGFDDRFRDLLSHRGVAAGLGEPGDPTNDDDLYAASLIDRVKDVKHTKGTLYFVGITFIYLMIGITILLVNYNEVINSPYAIFDIFKINAEESNPTKQLVSTSNSNSEPHI